MLQQTQVATVIPYYKRFLEAFPSVRELAAAPLDRVLALWSGLGYYRRARYLHLAAQDIVHKLSGRFPHEYHELRSLPGIGEYTAHAILSIAYNQPYAVLEGNVARVVSRLGAIRGSISQPAFRRAVTRALDGLLSRRDPGRFNQALMELGQTVCLPRAPRCQACPVRRWCRAHSLGKAESYPLARPRRGSELLHLACAVIRLVPEQGPKERSSRSLRRHDLEPPAMAGGGQERVALVRGLDDGLLSDMWNFPSAFGRSAGGALTKLEKKIHSIGIAGVKWDNAGGVSRARQAPAVRIQHGITYRSIRVEVYTGHVNVHAQDGFLHWLSLDHVDGAAVSQLARKVAEAVRAARVQNPKWAATKVVGQNAENLRL